VIPVTLFKELRDMFFLAPMIRGRQRKDVRASFGVRQDRFVVSSTARNVVLQKSLCDIPKFVDPAISAALRHSGEDT
jgi:hypothetical protein